MMIRCIDGDAQCIDGRKMSFIDGRLNIKLGCSIMDMLCGE